MDHLEATDLGATEKYLLGSLDDETRDAFEEHFFDCLECADEVRVGTALLAAAATETAALPAILPAASTRQPAVRPSAAEPAPAAPVAIQSAPRRRLARASGLAAAFAMAASLCLIAYQNAVVIPDLRAQAGEAGSIQAVRSYFLTQTRGEPAELHVADGDRVVALTLSRSSDRSFAAYRCELRDGSDRVVQSVIVPPSATGELELLLPVAGLASGDHVLVVEGLEDRTGAAGSTPVARYAFRVERR